MVLTLRVALVNPPTTANFETQNALGLKSPPLGLAYLASVLEKAGYNVSIIDAVALGLSHKQTASKLKTMKPNVIGITSITPTISDAMRSVMVLKEAVPDAVTVMGGCHITALPIDTMKSCPTLDYGVIGEGEITFLELVKAVESGSETGGIEGTVCRQSCSGKADRASSIIVNRRRALISNLDSVPFPARHLLPIDRYTLLGKRTPMGSIMTSRGCPYNCIFCSSSTFYGRVYRSRSPKNVVDEVEELINKYGLKFVEFIDDTMTLNKNRAKAIAIELLKRKLDITWGFGSRADLVDEEMLALFKRAGCIMFYMGIESGSERILRALKKGISLGQVKAAIACAKRAGLEVAGTFVMGTPWESRGDILNTIKFAKTCGIDYAQFTVMTPYPGTEVYEIAQKEGLLEELDWRKYTTIQPVMKTRYLEREDLARLMDEAYKSFYLRGKFMLHMVQKRHLKLAKPVIMHYILNKRYS